MPLHHRIRLIDHLTHASYHPSTIEEIAAQMRLDDEDLPEMQEAVEGMVKDGQLDRDRGRKLRLPEMPDEITGTLKLNARGFGFVKPDVAYRDGDLFVPAKGIGDAISGDRVRAEVKRQPWRQKAGHKSDASGFIVEVLERGRSEFTGELQKYGGEFVVVPDGTMLSGPIIIRDPHSKNAKLGDKVVVELTEYPEGDYTAEGVIVKVLGEAGRPDVETQATLEAFGLNPEFLDGSVQEARAAAKQFDDELEGGDPPAGAIRCSDREDLTKSFIFTIDPKDSKDFDDAISITFDEKKRAWELGVHIADVSHFVRPKSELDEEASGRGNSTYLPRLVIPMLPEVLSNGICSLHEGVPRFAKSVFVRFDGRGRVTGQRYASTIIKSAKRLTYEEAQCLIDGKKDEAVEHAKTEPNYTPELMRALKMADTLARTLRGRRQRDGMISLNLPDVELEFDEDGNVIDAHPEDDSFTHTVIEMFMVEANEAVARLFAKLHMPVLRRMHPEPSFGDTEELRKFAASVGFKLGDTVDRMDIQRLLDRTRDEPAARAIHFAVLRTLTKASYSPALIGHFALASDHYAHFTSPIRRYPDLQVHRALEAYLERTENGQTPPKGDGKMIGLGKKMAEDPRCPFEDKLVTLGNRCSGTEENSAAAERHLRSFLVLSFLQEKHLGHEFEGVCTGVTPNACFISIEKFLVEGMIKVAELPGPDEAREGSGGRTVEQGGGGDGGQGAPKKPRLRWMDDGGGGGLGPRDGGIGQIKDSWKLDDRTGRLVAKKSRRSLGMGDRVQVRIEAVDVAARHLDLVITELSARKAHKPSGGGDGDGGHDEGGRGSAAFQNKQLREQQQKRRDKQRRDREKAKTGRKRGGGGR